MKQLGRPGFKKQLKAYTALVGAVLGTSPARAAVVSTDVDPDQTFGVGQSVDIDLNGDGIDDLRVRQNGASGGNAIVSATPLNGAALQGNQPGNWGYPYALAYGATISAGQVFDVVGNAVNNTALNSYGQYGNWVGGNVDAYLGVRFDILGNTHFGWVHLEVTSAEQFILRAYAYESVDGDPILAGNQTAIRLQEFEIE
ncbi:MAG: hypothetical protein MI919_00845 [Holophagales bacterium]|nr:hypothetical protein [Holophagales bacterium]